LNTYPTGQGNVYTFAVLLNKGGSRFRAPREYRIGDDPEAIAIGDVNGDRKLDLVTANDYSNTISVLLNRGGGRFRAPRDYSTGASPTDLAVGDLNADGKADVATSNLNSIDTGHPRISVLLNKGDGSFGAKRNYRTGWIYSVAIGDLNGDRRPDLVVGSVWGFPSVLLNRGNGRFQAMLQYRVEAKHKHDSTGGEWAAIGDLNGDSKVDLATSNDDRNTVSVLINTPLCNVQDVRRMKLPAASRMLGRVNCRLGEVRRDHSRAFKRGLVMWQKPAGGAVRPNGDKVDLAVSLGARQ
jgi:FG-GAP-like repeat